MVNKTCFQLLIFMVATLTSCAAPPPPPPRASEAAINASLQEYMNCLRGAANKYDDGTSDILSIAASIQGACYTQFRDAIRLTVQGDNQYVQNSVMKRADGDRLSTAAAVVAQERARRRSSNP